MKWSGKNMDRGSAQKAPNLAQILPYAVSSASYVNRSLRFVL